MKFAIFVLAIALIGSEAFLFDHCKQNSDCGTDQCCVSRFPSNHCVHRKPRLAHCTLSGPEACGCASGMVCADPASLDIALEQTGSHGTGRCEFASKVNGATTPPA